MIRYTTPTIPFEVEADLTGAEVIASLAQGDVLQLDKVISSFTVDSGKTTFDVVLTQEETARFCAKAPVQVQVNAIFPDGTRTATNIVRISAFENLLDQVVNYGD